MKTAQILAAATATLLAATSLKAQAPAQGTTPPAATTPPATPGATTPAAAAKPFTAMEQRSLTIVGEALQFHLKMAEKVQHNKDDKELADFGNRVQSEVSAYWKPLVDLAQPRVKDQIKDIPQALSKSDKDEIDKLDKVKDQKKWKVEYFELFSKNAKKNARAVQSAVKTFEDPAMKEWGLKFSKLIDGQAEQIEASYKAAKNPKKDDKK